MGNHKLIELLKEELDYVELGGYEHARAQWRPAMMLEDSPVCLRFGHWRFGQPAGEVLCNECPLMALVPANHRDKSAPCRYIPLDSEGQTLNSLYRSAGEQETVGIFRQWLKTTLDRLE